MNIENEAIGIYHEMIKTYVDPLLAFCDIFIDGNGLLIDRETKGALRYANPKYKEGEEDKSPVIYLAVALTDEHYLKIKDDPALELFNPFTVTRHAFILAIKFKRALNSYFLSEETLELPEKEQDEFIQMTNTRSVDGNEVMEFLNYEDPNNPVVLYKYVSVGLADSCKAALGLCVTAFNDLNGKKIKEYSDYEKAWSKIEKKMEKFNKERKKIAKAVKEEEAEGYSVDHMDLSGGENIEAIFVPHQIKEYSEDDYVMEEDQDKYLTNLFSSLDLIPYVVSDEEEEIVKEKMQEEMLANVGEEERNGYETVESDNSLETQAILNENNNDIEKSDIHEEYQKEKIETSKRFKIGGGNPMMNNVGFNQFPQQGNVIPYGYGNMMVQNMPMNISNNSENIAELDLTGGTSPNPFGIFL